MEHNVFGNLDFSEDFWHGNLTIDFFKNTCNVELFVYVDEGEDFEQIQIDSFSEFMKKWDDIQHDVAEKLLNYYKTERKSLGYDKEANELYPDIDSVDEVLKMVNIVGLIVPYPAVCDVFEGRSIMIAMNCTWDIENGIGIRFLNEVIDEIGYQDVAF